MKTRIRRSVAIAAGALALTFGLIVGQRCQGRGTAGEAGRLRVPSPGVPGHTRDIGEGLDVSCPAVTG